MTPGAREEIERLANYTAHDIWHDLTIEGTKRKIFEVILTQVNKARREQIEEDAICAEDTKFIETCSERIVALVQLRHRIAKAIRNKLEKE